jgi:peptidoglycan hydrolase-like protein with peptidoglycan-binding domain
VEKGAHVAEPDAPEPVVADPQAAPAFPAAGAASREGVLFVQRHAGNAAAGRLLRARRAIARAVKAEGSPGKRENMDVGDTGPGVKLLQRLLGVIETGTFGQMTRKAVDRFQKQQGWDPSGVGPMTWDRLDNHAGTPGNRPNLNTGDRGPGVRLMQHILGVPETSVFDVATRSAVDAFQKKQGWTPGGVGPMTWAELDKERPRVEVADRMATMADPAAPTRAVWHPSGNVNDATDFSAWAMAAAEDPAFTVSPTTVINCWEMVLYSAWKQGVIAWSKINAIYTYAGPNDWFQELAVKLVRGGASTWDQATKKPKPRKGDIVMFDGAAHVALATGVTDAAGTHVYSFWPPPDTAFAAVDYTKPGKGKGVAAGTPDRVKDTTIEALVAAMGSSTVVTVGPPTW